MTQDDIVIEEAKQYSPQLAASLRILAAQLGANYQELTDDDVRELLTRPGQHLFIARDTKTDHIAGMAFLVVYRIPYVRKAYMDDLVVDASYRKRGIAKRLLQAVIDCARDNGAAYIDFTSGAARAGGNTFYEKAGCSKRDTNVYRITFDYGNN